MAVAISDFLWRYSSMDWNCRRDKGRWCRHTHTYLYFCMHEICNVHQSRDQTYVSIDANPAVHVCNVLLTFYFYQCLSSIPHYTLHLPVFSVYSDWDLQKRINEKKKKVGWVGWKKGEKREREMRDSLDDSAYCIRCEVKVISFVTLF